MRTIFATPYMSASLRKNIPVPLISQKQLPGDIFE